MYPADSDSIDQRQALGDQANCDSVIGCAPRGRPTAEAISPERTPSTSARAIRQPAGARRRLAASDEGHADRAPRADSTVGLIALVLGIHPTTDAPYGCTDRTEVPT